MAPATKASVAGRFARQAHAGAVDVAQLLGDAEGGQARAVGAEGIGLQNLRAGLDVLLVDLADQVGRREVQLVEAAVDEDAARVRAWCPWRRRPPGRGGTTDRGIPGRGYW